MGESKLVDEINGRPKMLRLSCFHGARGEEAILAEWRKPIAKRIQSFYLEAVRRLPIDAMPELVDCAILGGHCIGLLDPVSNIILNTLNLLCRRLCGDPEVAPTEGLQPHDPWSRVTWLSIALSSSLGLQAFVRTYFRYLTQDQARRYLHLAGADIPVAAYLIEHQHQLGEPPTADVLCPNDRTQLALMVAGAKAKHPAPHDLAWLTKNRPPPRERGALAAVLQKERALTVDDVRTILHFLHWQHSVAAQLTTLGGAGQQGWDNAARSSSGTFCITQLRRPEDIKVRFHSCLADATTTIATYCPHMLPRNDHLAHDDTPSTCEFTKYLKMRLLDTVHAFYIQAIALLPRNALRKHLRGILVAGTCYGLMDPVSNIIINSIWYDTAFPPQQQANVEVEPDILDSCSMLRMEARSLDGLIKVARTLTGFSEHSAVEWLCHRHCNLFEMMSPCQIPDELLFRAFNSAGLAAKHPKHNKLALFLTHLAPDKLQRLGSLLSGKCSLSDASMEEIYRLMMAVEPSRVAQADYPKLCPAASSMLVARTAAMAQRQRFLRNELEELLHDYASQHPWEQTFKLDVICGVEIANCDYSKCYHVNFLASNGTKQQLFFAEVWGSDLHAELSKGADLMPCTENRGQTFPRYPKVYGESDNSVSERSFCCPLHYYPYYRCSPLDAHLGRCSLCEPVFSKIVHPHSGNHTGADYSVLGDNLNYVHYCAESASPAADIVESDFVYFDYARDHWFAKVLNEDRLPYHWRERCLPSTGNSSSW